MSAGPAARCTILHLGLGSFHRAHQATYLQDLHALGDTAWVLASGNIRGGMEDVAHALLSQQGRYVLESVSPEGERHYARIDSLETVIPWQTDHADLLELGRRHETRIISFTVTEGGYYLDGDGRLRIDHPEVVADLTAARKGQGGCTLYGVLTALLRARRGAESGPVTLLCCDNLRHNGERSRSALLRFIEALPDPGLLEWTLENTASPNCMVDRITPRPTPALRDRVLTATGYADAAPVMAEQFKQWVIEDVFLAGRPSWETAGVQMVHDVSPHEEAKIRILNGSHSALAWAGLLAGYVYIHEGARDRRMVQIAHDYVTRDVIPCLGNSSVNLERYRDLTLERFRNVALADTNQRVAQDSYAKLQGFIAPTVRERIRGGASIEAVAMLPALYLMLLKHWHRGRLEWAYEDSTLDSAAVRQLVFSLDPVATLCADERLWGDCAGHPQLLEAIRQALQRVIETLGFDPM